LFFNVVVVVVFRRGIKKEKNFEIFLAQNVSRPRLSPRNKI
jgi:hypothetical protein